jgi:O-antigen/teichoic acid export membrane protein
MEPSIAVPPAVAAADATPTFDPTSRTEKAKAERVVSTSILISALRCTLSYVILPFVAPIIGIAGDLGPALGITISVVAIVANVFSIRRFWRADHKWKVQYTVLATCIILAMLVLMAQDLSDLLG